MWSTTVGPAIHVLHLYDFYVSRSAAHVRLLY